MSFINEAFLESGTTESRYFRPVKNKPNKVRILSERPTLGYLQWTEDGKPVRWPYNGSKPQANYQAESKPRKFMACAVWNYDAETVQVWEITQKSIMDALAAITNDSDFGHPNNFDLKITRTGEGLETQYGVIPISTPLDSNLEPLLANPGVNLEALFEGEDPFA